MKHFILISLSIALLYGKMNAQAKISLGFRSGFFIPELGLKSTNPVLDGYKSKLAPSFGLVLETGLNSKWSLLNELNYSDIRITKNGSQVIPKSAYSSLNLNTSNFPKYLYSTFESNIKLKYIEVPVMLKCYVRQNAKMNLFVNGGAFAGILFYGDLKTKGPGYNGTGYVYTDAAHNNSIFPFPINLNKEPPIQDRLQPFNFGLQAGIGCTHIGNAGEFFASANGAFGLINMQVDKGDGENKSKEVTLCVGYLIHLSK